MNEYYFPCLTAPVCLFSCINGCACDIKLYLSLQVRVEGDVVRLSIEESQVREQQSHDNNSSSEGNAMNIAAQDCSPHASRIYREGASCGRVMGTIAGIWGWGWKCSFPSTPV